MSPTCKECFGEGQIEDQERTVDTRLVLYTCPTCRGHGEIEEIVEEEEGEDPEEH